MFHDIDMLPAGDGAGVHLSAVPLIHPGAVVLRSRIGSWTEIGADSRIEDSEIGDYTYDAGEVSIVFSTVGKFCSIANRVRINPGNHPVERVTQHHMTYRRRQYGLDACDDDEFFSWRRSRPCRIGHDVWIGHAAVILAGVTIGTGAVVGAGAIVSKDVAPYQVVAGVPARPLRLRFSADVIERILSSRWWDWDREALEARWRDLCRLDTFLEKYSP